MNKEVRMADISVKSPTKRTAVAEGFIRIGKETLKMIKEDRIPKGNLMAVSKTAGISGAKLTPRILPLCHPVSITGCVVDLDTEENGVRQDQGTQQQSASRVSLHYFFFNKGQE